MNRERPAEVPSREQIERLYETSMQVAYLAEELNEDGFIPSVRMKDAIRAWRDALNPVLDIEQRR